jgi:hypothetical protein
MLAGTAIFYETRHQPTVALSSTNAEFTAAADAGKAALCLRSILHKLGVDQLLPTVICEDNNGARLMTNSKQPTSRTRHVELKQFAVLQWAEDKQIIFGDIGTTHNISDSLTKQNRPNQVPSTPRHPDGPPLTGARETPTSRPSQHVQMPTLFACDHIKAFDCFDVDLDTVTSMGR